MSTIIDSFGKTQFKDDGSQLNIGYNGSVSSLIINANSITATTIAVLGKPPFVISSTALNSNLNSELLGGHYAGDFALSGAAAGSFTGGTVNALVVTGGLTANNIWSVGSVSANAMTASHVYGQNGNSIILGNLANNSRLEIYDTNISPTVYLSVNGNYAWIARTLQLCVGDETTGFAQLKGTNNSLSDCSYQFKGDTGNGLCWRSANYWSLVNNSVEVAAISGQRVNFTKEVRNLSSTVTGNASGTSSVSVTGNAQVNNICVTNQSTGGGQPFLLTVHNNLISASSRILGLTLVTSETIDPNRGVTIYSSLPTASAVVFNVIWNGAGSTTDFYVNYEVSN